MECKTITAPRTAVSIKNAPIVGLMKRMLTNSILLRNKRYISIEIYKPDAT